MTETSQRAAWQNGGAVKVVEAMRAQPSCAQTQADGCGALAFLAAGAADHKRRVCAAGGAVGIGRRAAREVRKGHLFERPEQQPRHELLTTVSPLGPVI